jgi:hypothetical protein
MVIYVVLGRRAVPQKDVLALVLYTVELPFAVLFEAVVVVQVQVYSCEYHDILWEQDKTYLVVMALELGYCAQTLLLRLQRELRDRKCPLTWLGLVERFPFCKV